MPRDFTSEQCSLAAKVHDRIQQEKSEADDVPDPSPGPKDADERTITCLHEVRLWKATAKGGEGFEDALRSFPPFKVHGQQTCLEARLAEDKISAAREARAQRDKAEAERVRRAALLAEEAQVRREAAVRIVREAQAKKPGVRIGMTQQEVIEKSNWGAPQSRRRTTTAAGVSEQWIYDGNNYLYFENGKVVAIQN